MQFFDKENHGKHEIPAPNHHHAKLNKITGVNQPQHTTGKWCPGETDTSHLSKKKL